MVRRHERARGERGNGQGLTRGRERSSVGSGKPLQRRIDDGDLRAPEMKTTTLRSTAASSGRVRRVCSSTGSGRSSGMHSGSEGVAGRGVSQRSGHGGFGHEGKKSRGVRGREQRGKGADEGVPGGCRGILSRSGAGRQAGGGSGACVRAAATRSSFCPRTKTTGEGSGDGLGRLGGTGPAGGLHGWAPGKSFSVFYFYFSSVFFLFNSFATVLN